MGGALPNLTPTFATELEVANLPTKADRQKAAHSSQPKCRLGFRVSGLGQPKCLDWVLEGFFFLDSSLN